MTKVRQGAINGLLPHIDAVQCLHYLGLLGFVELDQRVDELVERLAVVLVFGAVCLCLGEVVLREFVAAVVERAAELLEDPVCLRE